MGLQGSPVRFAVLPASIPACDRPVLLVACVDRLVGGSSRTIIKVLLNHTSDRKQYGKPEEVPIQHEYCVVLKKPVTQGGNCLQY